MKRCLLLAGFLLQALVIVAQTGRLSGNVTAEGRPVAGASIQLINTKLGVTSDSTGKFSLDNMPTGSHTLSVSAVGFAPLTQKIILTEGEEKTITLALVSSAGSLDEVVVTGTLKEVKRIESPVPVEVYSPAFFRKNPTPNIFDALQNVNGVRPQLNCNVCNTGDIHINGLEGPFTLVLIDGMPIVSSLSTVYGLSGIPNALVERIEIVKGPASSLYGSEAVAGLVNIITKKPGNAPTVSVDVFGTTWQELNADLGLRFNVGKKASVLTGINYFNYGNKHDDNHDNFTDVTLQKRYSIFQKWAIARKDNRLFNLAARYFNEDRWGGELQWNKSFRGGDSVYGESIYTKRWEFLTQYQLPTVEKLMLWGSYNFHDQDSRYGTTAYNARQHIAFGQLTWDKRAGAHDLLAGAALRYSRYVDNTPATGAPDPSKFGTRPQKIWMPGIFVQDEISIAEKHKLLVGARYDYNSDHGGIFTPRIAYKFSPTQNDILRVNAGTGFRVVNIFTEDHAALTGARTVEIAEQLRPEKSYNINFNYLKKIVAGSTTFIGLDLSAWYTYFNNRIIPDFDTDPDKIFYNNLDGFAESKGVSANIDVSFLNGLKILAGATLMDISNTENGVKERPLFTENFTGTWAISYKIKAINLGLDYTGNIYGPMRLPVLSDLDPRPDMSPTWSIQNIQLVFSGLKNIEIYGGVKNILNWTPNRNIPFLIARPNDPFDKNVQFHPNGQVMQTPDNPYALTFDPTYMYAPNQGRRGFLGVRVTVR
jgi:outer membrane receptor for ferrienterochelin and colicins